MTNGRGVSLEMVSGNGTNFVRPNIESKEVVEALDTKEINRSGTEKGIRWHFISLLVSHFGGAQESLT